MYEDDKERIQSSFTSVENEDVFISTAEQESRQYSHVMM